MERYNVNEVANHFRVTSQTIYRWTEDCKNFMSDLAHPDKKGKQYFYTSDDMEVFSLLDEMRNTGRTTQEIIEALAKGERGKFTELNTPKDITVSEEQAFELRDRFELIAKERDEALAELQNARLEIAQLQSKAQRSDALESELKQVHGELRQLERTIGGLEAKLEMHGIDPKTGKKLD